LSKRILSFAAVALWQDLEHALGEDQPVLLGLGLEDLED